MQQQSAGQPQAYLPAPLTVSPQQQLHQQHPPQAPPPHTTPAQFMSPRLAPLGHHQQAPFGAGPAHHQHQHQHDHLHLQPTSQNLVHKQPHPHHQHRHQHQHLHHHQHHGHQHHQHHQLHQHHQHHSQHHHQCQHLSHLSGARLRQTLADYAPSAGQQQQQSHPSLAAAPMQVEPQQPQQQPQQPHQQPQMSPFNGGPNGCLAPSTSPAPAELVAAPFRPRVSSVSAMANYAGAPEASAARHHSPATPLIIRSTSFSTPTGRGRQPAGCCAGAQMDHLNGPPQPLQHLQPLQQPKQEHLLNLTPLQPPAQQQQQSPSFSPVSSSSLAGYSSPCSSAASSQQTQPGQQLSPSEALSLGINLEQYISKRNERERSRVRNVNDAFDNLKNSLPLEADKASKRMSKVEILRTAIGYIKNLEQVLGYKQAAAVGGGDGGDGADEQAPDGGQELQQLSDLFAAHQSPPAAPSAQSSPSPVFVANQQQQQQQRQPPPPPSQQQQQDSYVELMRGLDFDEFQQQQRPFE